MTLHSLEEAYQLTAHELLDALEQRFRARVALEGAVAEVHLEKRIRSLQERQLIAGYEGHDRDGFPDFTIGTLDGRGLTVECKNVRDAKEGYRRSGEVVAFKVETQKTRAATGDPSSRFYDIGYFDISETSGKQTNIGTKLGNEGVCQGLSALDRENGIYYVVGYNDTSRKPNLVGWDTKTGKESLNLDLPFTELPFVGFGQGIDVDQTSGDIIVIGQEKVDGMHHVAVRVDFKSHKISTLMRTKLDAPNIAILGGQCNTFDYVNKVTALSNGYVHGSI